MSLVKNTLIYTAGGFLPKVVSFLLLPVLTAYLSREDYGIVAALTSLAALVGIFATLQLPGSGMFRCYFDYHTEGERQRFIGTIVTAVSVMSLAAFTLCLVAHVWLQRLYPNIAFHPFYTLALAAMPLQVNVDTFQLLFRLQERPGPFVAISLANFLLNIGLTLWLVVGWHMGALGVLWAGVLAQACTLPAALWLSRASFRLAWDGAMFRNALMFSLQSLPYMVIAMVVVNIDRYLINHLSSVAELGIYGAAEKLAGVFNLLGGAVMMAFDPMFCRVASSEPLEQARVFLGSVSTQVIIAFVLLGTAAILFANDIVRLMMHPKFSATAAVLPWLLAAGVAGVVDGVGSIGAKYAKKVIWFVPVYLARGGLVIGLDLWLVPHLGAVGAGIANLATAVMVMLLRFACSRAFWPVPINLLKIAVAMGLGTLVVIIGLSNLGGTGFSALAFKLLLFLLYALWIIRSMAWWSYLHRFWSRLSWVRA
jgi:O-antigen/teichoic acid export membrane protein